MLRLVFLLLFIFLFGCKNPVGQETDSKSQLDSTTEQDTSTQQTIEEEVEVKPEPIYELIINKEERSEGASKEFDYSRNYTEEIVSELNLDSNKIGANEYYYLADQDFLKENIDSIDFEIYHRHLYGYYSEKMLLIEKPDTTYSLLLSAIKGDGSDSYRISTQFVNDDIFRETLIVKEVVADDQNLMAHDIDSIVTTYNYTPDLQLEVLQKDTFSYRLKKHSKNNRNWTTLSIHSKPFSFQGREYVWEYVMDQDQPGRENVLYEIYILSEDRKDTLLEGDDEMFSDIQDLFYRSSDLSNLQDIDFDGHGDLTIYNNVKSGSAGSFSDTYIYNPEKEIFEFSEKFSGYNLRVDREKRTLSTAAKAGVGINSVQVIHFKSNSEIDFIQKFQSDRVDGNIIEQAVFYQKIVDDKVVESASDTVSDVGFWEWQKRFE